MKKIVIPFLIGLLVGACESFVTGIDEADITKAQDADLRQAFIGAEVAYQGALEGNIARICGLWSGYFYGAILPAKGYFSYDVSTGTFNQAWSNVYASALKNLRIVQEKAIQYDNRSTLGAARVMEASLIGTAAALWGDVPWYQAARAEEYPDPRYDNQHAVIDSLLILLDSAIVNLSATSTREGDFLFSSAASNSAWIRVAHSMRARLLLYIKDYSGSLAAANLGIQNPADDLVGKHGAGAQERNMYWEFLANSAWIGSITASNTHLGGLLNAGHPGNRNHTKTNEGMRLARYYSGSSVPTYVPNTSSSGFFAQTAPFPIHTASETKLIAAECYAQVGDFTNALLKLNEHRANLRTTYPTGMYSDFGATDFDPGGIENSAASLTSMEALLREILEEKYVCLYGQAESFNEWRRNGNAIGLLPNVGSEMPQRFLYSQTELNANVNTPKPVPGLFEKTLLFQ